MDRPFHRNKQSECFFILKIIFSIISGTTIYIIRKKMDQVATFYFSQACYFCYKLLQSSTLNESLLHNLQVSHFDYILLNNCPLFYIITFYILSLSNIFFKLFDDEYDKFHISLLILGNFLLYHTQLIMGYSIIKAFMEIFEDIYTHPHTFDFC